MALSLNIDLSLSGARTLLIVLSLLLLSKTQSSTISDPVRYVLTDVKNAASYLADWAVVDGRRQCYSLWLRATYAGYKEAVHLLHDLQRDCTVLCLLCSFVRISCRTPFPSPRLSFRQRFADISSRKINMTQGGSTRAGNIGVGHELLMRN